MSAEQGIGRYQPNNVPAGSIPLKETEGGRAKLCKAMEDMRNEAAVKASIVAYNDAGIKDEKTILSMLQKRFDFLTTDMVKKYIRQLRDSAAIL